MRKREKRRPQAPPAYRLLLTAYCSLVRGNAHAELQYVCRATRETATEPVGHRGDRHVLPDAHVVADATEDTEAAIGGRRDAIVNRQVGIARAGLDEEALGRHRVPVCSARHVAHGDPASAFALGPAVKLDAEKDVLPQGAAQLGVPAQSTRAVDTATAIAAQAERAIAHAATDPEPLPRLRLLGKGRGGQQSREHRAEPSCPECTHIAS